ncbi:hypothetical protein ACFPIJ_64215 [Dactylosporangium cerinum]|uniref:N-acetyltransferase domain-containing protein n=1 Tax=Dactylosporangium cerinum TaxID=1434730 RepID=A0ABV9WIY2_9ACTN
MLYMKRYFFFNHQDVRRANGQTQIQSAFYERLPSVDEIFTGLHMWRTLSVKGVEFGNMPGYDLVTGIFPSIYDAPQGVVPMPDPNERCIGDHDVLPIDLDGGRVYFAHHWGRDWGDNGLGSYSVEYVKRHGREAWATRQRPGPVPQNVSRLTNLGPDSGRKELLLKHPWNTPSVSGYIPLHEGKMTSVFGRWLIGATDGSIALQALAVVNKVDKPVVVGWMHVRGTEAGAAVEEFFVWPTYRQRGIGTTLAGQTLLFAATTTWRERPISWHVTEPDSLAQEIGADPSRVPNWLKSLDFSGSPERTATVSSLTGLLIDLASQSSVDGIALTKRANRSSMVTVVNNDWRRPTYGIVVG